MSDFVAHKSGLKFSRVIECHPVNGNGDSQIDWKGSVTLDGSGLEVESVCCQLKSRLTPAEAKGVLGVSSRCTVTKGDKRKLKLKIYDRKAFDTQFFLFINKKPVQLPLRIVQLDSGAEDTEITMLEAVETQISDDDLKNVVGSSVEDIKDALMKDNKIDNTAETVELKPEMEVTVETVEISTNIETRNAVVRVKPTGIYRILASCLAVAAFAFIANSQTGWINAIRVDLFPLLKVVLRRLGS
ncbi:hypothetical protein QR680_016459 [Steinernema hermaphroditum]|uniref:Uncharacterized protein n=1 Tax=Steinernema hermaphroditum TaxID=289476 RepID=A0AA39HDR2_9BILA|nr:hypothetical protein QR680_016459 [Steinernema hermaphroditum]